MINYIVTNCHDHQAFWVLNSIKSGQPYKKVNHYMNLKGHKFNFKLEMKDSLRILNPYRSFSGIW